MEHATLSSPLSEVAQARLDHLIAEVANSPDPHTALLLEHLQSARTYVLGAMPDEYEFSLAMSKEFGRSRILVTRIILMVSCRSSVRHLFQSGAGCAL